MLNDITLGQYFPSGSVIHKLDPRFKIINTILLIVLLFMCKSIYSYALIFVFIGILIILSKVPFTFVLKGLKPIVFIAVFTGVINLFLNDGKVLFQIGFITATYEGLYIALKMIVRLVLLITATSLLTLTTSPIMLTDGLERLLSPFKKLHLPVHELSMMMTIALRFIPTLLEETDKIIKAQNSRGADFNSGSLIKKAKAMVPILIPLFINAFKRADELATAMECRCYRGGEGRTRLKVLKTAKNDIISVFVMLLLMTVIIFIN